MYFYRGKFIRFIVDCKILIVMLNVECIVNVNVGEWIFEEVVVIEVRSDIKFWVC